MVKLLHLGQTIIIGDTAFKLLKGKSSVIAAARTTSLLSEFRLKKSNVPRKRDTRYPSKPGYGYSSPPYYTKEILVFRLIQGLINLVVQELVLV